MICFRKDQDFNFNQKTIDFLAKVSWSATVSNGMNFRSHYLKKDLFNGDLYFVKTLYCRAFESIFFICGLAMIIGFIYSNCAIDSFWGIMFLLGIIFAFVGSKAFFREKKPIFSHDLKAFYKSKKRHTYALDLEKLADYTPFSEVIALQIIERIVEIRKHRKSGTTKTIFYELNLILKDATRIHVMTNGCLLQITFDANTLAEKLDLIVLYKGKKEINSKRFIKM